MRLKSTAAQIALIAFVCAAPLRAQNVVNLTTDMLDRFLKGADQEQVDLGKSGDQLRDLDEKIKKFRECRTAFEVASGNAGGKLGMAAKIAMRAKCGATDEDGFQKDRQKITDGPLNNAAKVAGMKTGDYSNLKDKITGYMNGDRSGFSAAGLDLLHSRESDLSKSMGMPVMQAGSANMGSAHMSGAWTTDYAWAYIGQLFALQYASGASMFEVPYKVGEWTQWVVTTGDKSDDQQTIERAFLAINPDSTEWWRMKTMTKYQDNGASRVDTVVLEALYKSTSPYTKELVRVRAKLPGNKDAQELMVPAGMAMLNSNGLFPTKPTKESVDGATLGTESVSTKAGSFSAKHVRFGAGQGNVDWWLTPDVPGGWVKFTGGSGNGLYTMELTAKGTGARSELGVIK